MTNIEIWAGDKSFVTTLFSEVGNCTPIFKKYTLKHLGVNGHCSRMVQKSQMVQNNKKVGDFG